MEHAKIINQTSEAVPVSVNNVPHVIVDSAPPGGSGMTDAEFTAHLPLAISDNGGSLTVDGTVAVSNFPATQPVSGTVTANVGTGPWPVTDNGGSLTVDGVFFQVTQPVSAAALPLPSGAATSGLQTQPGVDIGDVTINNAAGAAAVNVQDGGNSITVDGTVAVSTVTTLTTITNVVHVDDNAGTLTVDQPTGTNLHTVVDSGTITTITNAVTVTPPTLTKNTQGATGFSTQNLKDAGRVNIQFYATGAASGTTGTETIITLTKSADTSATTTGTTFVITNAKRFRITSIYFASQGNVTATTQVTTFNIRINTAGAVIASSTPLVLSCKTQTPATTLAWDRVNMSIPDGVEYTGNGTIQIGISANAVFVTNAPTWNVLITGFEY